jgi:hypothetical protein
MPLLVLAHSVPPFPAEVLQRPPFSARGKGHDGKGVGATWIPQGKVGGAYSFNGRDNSIDVPALNQTWTTFTIATWVRIERPTDPGDGKIVDMCNSSTRILVTASSYDRLQVGVGSTGFALQFISVQSPLVTKTWEHLAYIYNGSHVLFYINSKLVYSNDVSSGTFDLTGGEAKIGQEFNDGAPRHFNGLIDEVRVYNRALSEDDVKMLYGAQE